MATIKLSKQQWAFIGKKAGWMKVEARGCDQCEVLTINGIPCHENGCPNKHIDPSTQEPYVRKCKWCGSEHKNGPKFDFCDEECVQSYNS